MGKVLIISYFLTITTSAFKIFCVCDVISKSWDIEQAQRLYNSQKHPPVPKIVWKHTQACSSAIASLGLAEMEGIQETVSSGSAIRQSNVILRIKTRGTNEYKPTADDVQRALDFVYNAKLPQLNTNTSKLTTDEIRTYNQHLERKNQYFAKLKLWRAKFKAWTAKCKILASDTDDRYIIISMGKTNENHPVYFYYSIAGIREKAHFQHAGENGGDWMAKHYLFVIGYVIPLEQPKEENVQSTETRSVPISQPNNIVPKIEEEETGRGSGGSKFLNSTPETDNDSTSVIPKCEIRRRGKLTRCARIGQLSSNDISPSHIHFKIPSNKSEPLDSGKSTDSHKGSKEKTEMMTSEKQSSNEPSLNEANLKFNISNYGESGKPSVTDQIPKLRRRRLVLSPDIGATESSSDDKQHPKELSKNNETNFQLPSTKYLEEKCASYSKTISELPSLSGKKHSSSSKRFSELKKGNATINKRKNSSSKQIKMSPKELYREESNVSSSKSELKRKKLPQKAKFKILPPAVETPSLLEEKSKTERECT